MYKANETSTITHRQVTLHKELEHQRQSLTHTWRDSMPPLYSDYDPQKSEPVLFRQVSRTVFRPELIVNSKARAELSKNFHDRSIHIYENLARESNSINSPWSWHIIGELWSLNEISIEVCDAWPSYREDNLDAWLDNVGFFCPLASRVKREIPER